MFRLALIFSASLLLAFLPVYANPTFNRHHGVCTTPFLLKVKSEDAGAVVRYTTDGSKPTAESPLFTSNLYVSGTTIIRAAEFKAGARTSDVVTASYIFPATVLRQPALPDGYPASWGSFTSMSGTAPADYEMDPELTSIHAYARKIMDAFYSIPALSIVTDKGNLFNREKDELTGGIYIYTGTSDTNGRGWERAASIELMGCGHDLTTTCALKIHGGQGRVPEKNPKHSFRLTFKDTYGSSRLNYPVFGLEGPTRFNSLVVRTFYNYSWTHSDASQRAMAQYGRDLWARVMLAYMGHDTSRCLYVNVFINGLYWGLYNLSERIDDHYGKYHYGGLTMDYDVISREDRLEASAGSLDKWNLMMQLSSSASSPQTYAILTGHLPLPPDTVPSVFLDIDNFIDYMLINQYAGNNDWDHHNWIALSNRSDPASGFRFFCWDSEQTLFSASKNVLDVNNKDCPTFLFHNMMKNPAFRHLFISRAYKHLEDEGGLLRPAQALALWDSLQQVVSLAIYAESARWGDYRRDVHPYTSPGLLYRADVHHAQENTRLRQEFFPHRTATLISQLKKKGWYAGIDAPVFLLNGIPAHNGDTILRTDTLTLAHGSYIMYTTDGSCPVQWDGNPAGEASPYATLYSSENIVPYLTEGLITLRATCKEGNSWSATVTRNVYVTDETTTGIADLNDLHRHNAHNALQDTWFDLNGRKTSPARGIYITKGKKILK